MKVNIPSKNIGDQLTSTEFNQVVTALNATPDLINDKVNPAQLEDVNLSDEHFVKINDIIRINTDSTAVQNSTKLITSGYIYSLLQRVIALENGSSNPGDNTAPSIPTGLAATKTSTSISASWNSSTDNVAVVGYDLSVNGIVQSVIGISVNLTGLNSSTQYTLRVRAKDAAGNVSAYSTDLVITTDVAGVPDTQAPTVPTNLQGTATSNSIVLNWNASTDNVGVIGYDVEVNGVVQSSIANSITINSLSPNTQYSIRVRAKDAAGNNSPYTSILVVSTQPAEALVIEKTFYLNFKGQYGTTAAGYNNIWLASGNASIQNNVYGANTISGSTISLYDSTNTLSPVSISVTRASDNAAAGGSLPNPANSAVLIDNPYQTYWTISNGSAGCKIRFSGLSIDKSYHFAFMGSGGFVNSVTEFKIDSVAVSKNTTNNFGLFVNRDNPFVDSSLGVINNVHPNAQGEIEVEINKPTAVIAYLNALIIQQSNIDKV